MATTYEAIATVTVGSGGAASIDFTSIPATFTDLLLLISARVTRATNFSTIVMQFNNNTSNYSDRFLRGSGSAATSGTSSGSDIRDMTMPAANATANTFGNLVIYIPNYAGSTNKSVSIDSVSERNDTEAFSDLTAGLWSDSAAITSIKFTEPNGSSNFAQHSTATLYGIKKS